MGTHHIDGQDVETFTLSSPEIEGDRLALRRRHLGQVRAYGARMGGSLVLQTSLVNGWVGSSPAWYRVHTHIEMEMELETKRCDDDVQKARARN